MKHEAMTIGDGTDTALDDSCVGGSTGCAVSRVFLVLEARRASPFVGQRTSWCRILASTVTDWAADSAFRFFPIVQDALLGWRLHHVDAATSTALTLAARTETRDYIDILELHQQFPFAAICWAACGKDDIEAR